MALHNFQHVVAVKGGLSKEQIDSFRIAQAGGVNAAKTRPGRKRLQSGQDTQTEGEGGRGTRQGQRGLQQPELFVPREGPVQLRRHRGGGVGLTTAQLNRSGVLKAGVQIPVRHGNQGNLNDTANTNASTGTHKTGGRNRLGLARARSPTSSPVEASISFSQSVRNPSEMRSAVQQGQGGGGDMDGDAFHLNAASTKSTIKDSFWSRKRVDPLTTSTFATSTAKFKSHLNSAIGRHSAASSAFLGQLQSNNFGGSVDRDAAIAETTKKMKGLRALNIMAGNRGVASGSMAEDEHQEGKEGGAAAGGLSEAESRMLMSGSLVLTPEEQAARMAQKEQHKRELFGLHPPGVIPHSQHSGKTRRTGTRFPSMLPAPQLAPLPSQPVLADTSSKLAKGSSTSTNPGQMLKTLSLPTGARAAQEGGLGILNK